MFMLSGIRHVTITQSPSKTLRKIPHYGPRLKMMRDIILHWVRWLLNRLLAWPGLHFFPPVKGMVSGKFDPRLKHFGTDIVTKPKSPVDAALDGTVIFTGWTMETGFVIEVQHSNNIVSVYKHNASLLKEQEIW